MLTDSHETDQTQYCTPDPDPFGAYADLARCDRCGALDGVSGAPVPAGIGWVSEVDIIVRHGIDYDDRQGWRSTARCLPERTVLTGGRCQFCGRR